MSKIDIYRNRLNLAKSTKVSLIKNIKDAKADQKINLATLKSDYKTKLDRLNVRLIDTQKRIDVIEKFLAEHKDPELEVDAEINTAIAPVAPQ